MSALPATMLQLHSLITSGGSLELSLVEVPLPEPGDDDILVRIEAAPINPSDIGLLFGAADMATAQASGAAERPVVTATVPPALMRAMAARADEAMPVGNEAGGIVVAAGKNVEAMIGRAVGIVGGAMYAQYRAVPARDAIVLPDGASPEDGAACFVNPLTALGMTETMRREGHAALVHTAAASNLGQMLNRICLKDGIALVNIVRSAEQAATLRGLGASHVLDSTAPDFMSLLIAALVETGATIAFDAVGGGRLAGQILTAMESAIISGTKEYSRYGSAVHKQVYLYGMLDPRPTEFSRGFGMAWGIGGWLLFPFLQRIGAADAQRLRDRVAAELTTTFASHYTARVSLAGALSLDAIAAYNRRATGEKYLITPQA